MSDQQEAIDLAQAGAAFENFSRSEVGRIMYFMAERDEMIALRKIVDADPENGELIRKLQLEARAPRQAIQWIEKVVFRGKEAKRALELEDQEIDQGETLNFRRG